MGNKKEIIRKLNKVINDLIDIQVETEYGSWEEFEKQAREEFPGIYSDEFDVDEIIKELKDKGEVI